jgi:hypothetical protein
MALLDFRDLFGCPFGNDPAAAVSAFGAHIDQPVGRLDDIEIVFDDQNGVACGD